MTPQSKSMPDLDLPYKGSVPVLLPMDFISIFPVAPTARDLSIVFVYDPEMLKKMHDALSAGNEWARAASMIIAVLSKKEYDCVIRERVYHQFDTGMATATTPDSLKPSTSQMSRVTEITARNM
jgi:hypothetical protein